MTDESKQLGKRHIGQWFLVMFLFPWLCSAVPVVGVCRASQIEVRIEKNAVEVISRQAPLIEVLKELSGKAGCVLTAEDSLEDIVTLDLKTDSLEACLRRIMAHRNYAIYYRRLEDQSTAIMEIRVFGGNAPIVYGARAQSDAQPDDHMRHVGKKWYETNFSDTESLAKQISAKKVHNGAHAQAPHPSGIQMTSVSEHSVFSQIGIKKGDIIHDVNGRPVGSTEELVNAMRMVSGASPPIIRLERTNPNGELDPIYIELY